MLSLRIVGALALAIAASVGRADIYGYVDGDGVSHFAAEALDSRYRLFARGNRLTALPTDAPTAAVPSGFAPPPGLATYEALLTRASKEFAVDLALLKAIVTAESGFDPAAVSVKGAIGLMQVMPATAERYGVVGDRRGSIAQKLRDPAINVRVGTRYLADLIRMFPRQPHLVIASYNAGEGAVMQYNNRVPPYRETRNYVELVSQLHAAYQPTPAPPRHAALRGRAANDGRRLHLTLDAPARAGDRAAAVE